MSILQMLPYGGRAPDPLPELVDARVSTLQPLPASFADPVFVVVDHDPDHAYRVDNWPACHGGALPKANAPVLLAFVGDARTPRILHWGSDAHVPVLVGEFLPQTFSFSNLTACTCVHNLGRRPVSISVYGPDGTQRLAPVTNPDVNTTVVSFNSPQSGSVVLV